MKRGYTYRNMGKMESRHTRGAAAIHHREKCFLQALFGQNCKIFLDIVAKRFWTLLHVQIGQSCNAPAGCIINQP